MDKLDAMVLVPGALRLTLPFDGASIAPSSCIILECFYIKKGAMPL